MCYSFLFFLYIKCFSYKTGSLKFKTSWWIYNTKRGIGVHCLLNLCPYLDNILHVQQCLFFDVKWKQEYLDSEEQLAEYLLQLNRERIRKFRMPIIWTRCYVYVLMCLNVTIWWQYAEELFLRDVYYSKNQLTNHYTCDSGKWCEHLLSWCSFIEFKFNKYWYI